MEDDRTAVMPDRNALLDALRAERPALERSGVRRAALFGSVARGDANTESDVDVLVVLDPEAHIGLIRFAKLQEYLQRVLGRHVDLLSHRALSPDRDAAILADAVWAF
jgi:uncharacterized protein